MGLTVKELLSPAEVPSAAFMVAFKLGVVKLTKPVQTPLEKTSVIVGVMVPIETLKVGVPLYSVTVLP